MGGLWVGVRQDHGASTLVREEEEVNMAPSEMAGLFCGSIRGSILPRFAVRLRFVEARYAVIPGDV